MHPGLTVKHPNAVTVADIYHALIPFHPPGSRVRCVRHAHPRVTDAETATQTEQTCRGGSRNRPGFAPRFTRLPNSGAATLGRSEENRKEVRLVLNRADDRHLGGLGGLWAAAPCLCSPPAWPPGSLMPARVHPPGLRSLSLSPRSSVTFTGTYPVVCAFPAHPPGVGVPRSPPLLGGRNCNS